MPRKTKKDLAAEALAADVQAAIARLPFSPLHAADSPDAFPNLPEAVQEGIAHAIFADFAVGGLSGADCRKKYGGTNDAIDGTEVGLSGKRRRNVLRAYGLGAGVARSYVAYSDGESRKGSAHARQHGANAAERQAEQARLQAEAAAEQAKQDAKREARAMRKELRAAGADVPRGDAAMRAMHAEFVAATAVRNDETAGE